MLYVYGGWDGQKAHNTLHQLNLKTLVWSEVKVENPNKAPCEMSGCGLVAHGTKLVLFGGYGVMNEKKEKEKTDKKGVPTSETTTVSVDKAKDSEDENRSEDKGTKEADSGSLEPSANGAEEKTESNMLEASLNGVKEDNWAKETLALVTIEDVRGEGKGEGGMETTEKDAVEKKSIEDKENSQSIENGVQGCENITPKNETTVEVTETVREKSKKAVVIKLPESYELADERDDNAATATEEQDKAEETSSQKEQSSGSVSLPEVAGEVSVKDDQEAEEEEEMNTTFSIYKRNESDQKGWTNEVKIFDLVTGKAHIQCTYTCIHVY